MPPNPHRPLVARAAACLAAVGCVLLIKACGLETYPGILPPEVYGSALGFRSPADLTDPGHLAYFQGYDVYYKLYPALTDPGGDSAITTREGLESSGFHRFTRETDDPLLGASSPLFFVDPADRENEHYVAFSFSVTDHTLLATVSWDAEPLRMLRGVPFYGDGEPDDAFQDFTDFDPGDAAVTGSDLTPEVMADIEAGLQVKIALYALSYGRDATAGELRSEPTYLFYEPVTLTLESP